MKRIIILVALLTILPTIGKCDNITVTQGSGKTVAFDDISSVNYQRIKLIHGADGTNSGDVATANPLPIQLRTSGGTETGTSGNPIQCSLANTGANSTAVKVDGSAVTQPISASSLPLPAGAATDTNQSTQITSLQLLDDVVATSGSAIPTKGYAVSGTDGTNARVLKTDSSGELQVDAIQSGTWNVTNVSGTVSLPTGAATSANQSTEITSLQLIDDVVKTDDTAFTPATDKVSMIGAEVDNTFPDSVDEGDAGAVRMSANRNIYMQIRDGYSGAERGAWVDTTGNLAVSINNATNTNPVSVSTLGTVKNASSTLSMTGANTYRHGLSDGSKGYGISAVQITGTWTGAIKFQTSQDSNVTYQDVPVIEYSTGLPVSSITSNGTFWLGVSGATDLRLAVSTIGTGTASITVNSIGNNGGLSQVAGTVVKASDDSSSYLSIDLDETEEEVKATSAVFKGYYYRNESSSTRYIKLYNGTAADTDVGTDEPKLVFPIPASSAANVLVPDVLFNAGLTAACTTGILHTDVGAPGANECVVNIYYK